MSSLKQLVLLGVGLGLFFLGLGYGLLGQGLGYGLLLMLFLGLIFAIIIIPISGLEYYLFKQSFFRLMLINLGTCISTFFSSIIIILFVFTAVETLLLRYESLTSIIMFASVGFSFLVIKSIFITFFFEDLHLRKQMILFNALVSLVISLLGIFMYRNFILYLTKH